MPRNASGVYTLPNPPVVTDTTITATDENVTRDDMANELTNSLSRNGQGGMLAPFRIADGVLAAPGLSFTNDPDSGLWRSAADTWHLVAGAAVSATVSNAGITIPAGKTLNVLGTITGGVGGVVALADGTQALPSLAFASDLDAGIYRSGADTWHLVANAKQAGTVNEFGLGVAEGVPGGTARLAVALGITQIAANTSLALLQGVHTLNAANALAFQGLGITHNLDQSGFNATAANRGALTGIFVQPAVIGAAGTVTRAVGVYNSIRNTGLGTITELVGYHYQPANSGGGTVSESKGFLAENHNVGSTLNAGFVGELVAGVNKWNLYMSGTASNYLLGPVTFGIADFLIVEGVTPPVQIYGGLAAINRFSANGVGNFLYFNKSRGTLYNQFNVLAVNDDIASLKFFGADGVTLREAAAILVEVDAVPVAGAVSGRIIFALTDAAGVNAEQVRIDSSGMSINTGATPEGKLHVRGGAVGAGAVTANAQGNVGVFEGSGSNGISILTPAANSGHIFFGSPVSNVRGSIRYDHTTDSLEYWTAGVYRGSWTGGGQLLVGNFGVAINVGVVAGLEVAGTTVGNASIYNGFFAANASGANQTFSKSRNATIGAHTAVVVNDNLGLTRWFGSDGAAFVEAARVTVLAATVAAGAIGGRWLLETADAAGVLFDRLLADHKGNIIIGGAVPNANAAGVLAIQNATGLPAAGQTNGICIYSKDSSVGAANATFALRTEQAVEAIGTFTASHKIRVWINETEYHISLDAV